MNQYSNPITPSIPGRAMKAPSEAKRVEAHKTDGVRNDMKNAGLSEKPMDMGKLGLTGNGNQK